MMLMTARICLPFVIAPGAALAEEDHAHAGG